MKAKVDLKKCEGIGICEQICPAVFRVNGDQAQVQIDMVPADAEDLCRQAMRSCPTEAISMEG